MNPPRSTTTRKRWGLALIAAFALAGVGTSVALDALAATDDSDATRSLGVAALTLPEGAGPEEWPNADRPDSAGEWDDADTWDDASGAGDAEEWDEEAAGWDDDAQPLATFAAEGDHLDVGDAPREVAKQATAIWSRFTQLIPADQRTMLVGFELMPEEYEGAHVYPSDRDPNRWIMGIGLGLGDELDATLIHEFGHLLTLQAKEVPPESGERGCATYFTGEGCALSGSTFAGFVQRFWPQAMIDQVEGLEESGDWDAAGDFSQEHRDVFVTDYATTNPAEDLAETFTVFVTRGRPSGSTIADQKVEYFWSDPDMVELRTRIRAGLTAT